MALHLRVALFYKPNDFRWINGCHIHVSMEFYTGKLRYVVKRLGVLTSRESKIETVLACHKGEFLGALDKFYGVVDFLP